MRESCDLFPAPRRKVTSDINVQCVFNNAGFIVTGFYESSPEGKQMANLECNATASAKVRRFLLLLLFLLLMMVLLLVLLVLVLVVVVVVVVVPCRQCCWNGLLRKVGLARERKCCSRDRRRFAQGFMYLGPASTTWSNNDMT